MHKHHVIPKHAGGTDDPSNIVLLTVEEHASAHKKLYEKYGRWQDKCAWLSLSNQIGKEEIQKMIASEANKGARSGRRLEATLENAKKGNKMWTGQKHSEESKKLIAESNKKYWSEQKVRPWAYVSKYTIEGVDYTGVIDIVEKYKISRQTLYNRCKSDKFPDWIQRVGRNG